MRLAVGNSRIHPRDIEAINAWAPGHKLIDLAEAKALQAVFGTELQRIPCVSLKGAIGNPLGAAGAIQLGCAALSMRNSILPPTVNWQYPDPSCELNLSASPRYVEHRVSLVNAHGLSGTNSCLVLTR
jgi:3-oxoacyl-(acyl-carrier-protein) synthase